MTDHERLMQEAYIHGRTLEQLTMALQAIQRIVTLCQAATQRPSIRLLRILVEADTTLKMLAAPNGGIIDDAGVPK